MDLTEYRKKDLEKARTEDLMALIPLKGNSVIDIGARDGWFSKKLTEYYRNVTALDLEKPRIEYPNIRCVKGDVTYLEFDDSKFDLAFCAEVLEHIPTQKLEKACSELIRVSMEYIIVGVPYKQDIRVGRTKCQACGKKNPPWGHLNRFTRKRLETLFHPCRIVKISFVGENNEHTNILSTILMDLAGNPLGTYNQDETCVHCDAKLEPPGKRNLLQMLFTRIARYIRNFQKQFCKPHPNWIHILFEKVEHH